MTVIRKTKKKTRVNKKNLKKPTSKFPKGNKKKIIRSNICGCVMCGKKINVKNECESFMPSKCLSKHGSTAHRICSKCWFDEFAKEGVNHACPGCKNKKPLCYPVIEKKKDDDSIIDLTSDSP